MRADRLISIILLLQERGRLSASALARELEVSVRTIFRDIDALCVSGFPIYAEPGSQGGYALLDDFRTDLTGFKTQELLALLLTANSPAARYLGIEEETGTALRKLHAALPEIQRQRISWYRERLLIDPVDGSESAIRPFDPQGSVDLSLLYRAVLESRKIRIRIVWPRPDQAGEYEVMPLGLIESSGGWYLAAGLAGFAKIYPLEALSAVQVLGERFERPGDFRLPDFWQAWKEAREHAGSSFPARLEISPGIIRSLDRYVREDVPVLLRGMDAAESGRYRIQVTFSYFHQARRFVLANGGAVKVLGPEELKRSVIDYAEKTLALYKGDVGTEGRR